MRGGIQKGEEQDKRLLFSIINLAILFGFVNYVYYYVCCFDEYEFLKR